MRTYGGVTRRELFERLDKPQLRPLPQDRLEISEWLECRVNHDYHVVVFKHFYSVPHTLVTEDLEVRITRTTVEMFFRGPESLFGPFEQRGASWHRSFPMVANKEARDSPVVREGRAADWLILHQRWQPGTGRLRKQ